MDEYDEEEIEDIVLDKELNADAYYLEQFERITHPIGRKQYRAMYNLMIENDHAPNDEK